MSHFRHYNPVVFDRKTVFMQRLADRVRMGYRYYVLGEVHPDRAQPLAAKFARLYEVHLHRNRRALSRANGEASAYALWWKPHTEHIVFALLLTPGTHAACQLEKLRDASTREGRLTLGDYELVQRARDGQARASWTWRLVEEAYESYRAYVLQTVRGGNELEVRQLIDDVLALPGFAGIRDQVKKLRQLFRSEWRRRRPGAEIPEMPRQRFVQRLRNGGVRLSEVSQCRQSAIAHRHGHGVASAASDG